METKSVELKIVTAKSAYEEADTEEPTDELPAEVVKADEWSISFLLYKYRKILNDQSIRDLQFAVQFTCSFVISVAIAYFSHAFTESTGGISLLPWVTPLMLMDTVAGTVIQIRACLFTYIPMAIFMEILMQIGMGYRDFVSSTIVFFFTCFYIGYLYTNITQRKIALILPIVFFVTLVNTKPDVIHRYFVWEVLTVVLLGLSVDLAVTLCIFPRFACLECQDRFSYSLARNEEVLELAMKAMFSNHRANAEVFLCEANAIIVHINANQEVMYTRSAIANWEPIALVRFLYRRRQTLFNSYSIPDLTQISAYLTWHSTATVHAAAHMHFNEFHSTVGDLCRDAFLSAESQYKALIRLLRQRSHNKDQINLQIVELKRALDHMHASLSEAYRAADKIVSGKEPASPVFSGKYYNSEGESDEVTDKSDDAALLSGSYKLYDGDSKKEANRLTFSYWLFHMSELIQTVENKFCTNAEGHIASTYSVKSGDSKPSPYKQCWAVMMMPVQYVIDFYQDFVKDWQSKLKTGFHTALLLGVGLIFAEVPRMTRKFENGQWIMFAMLMSTGDNLGNSFHVMRNRFLGTLFGAIFGYFVFIAVGANYHRIIGFYVPFLLICGVIKQNKLWSYFGSISATTALIITFGRIPYEDPLAGDYSLLRIQQNVIGILLSLCLNLMSVPIFATDLLKFNIVKVFCQLGQATTAIGEAYVSTVTSVNLSKNPSKASSEDEPYDLEASLEELDAVEQAKKELKILFIQPLVTGVKSGISQQPTLIEQSTFETIFWSKAMPESVYLQLIPCERKVLHMLVTIDRALLRISKISDLRAAETCLLFARSLSKRVTLLLEQVSMNLNLWSSEMRASMWHDLCEDDSEVVRVNHVRTREEHLQGLELMDQSAKSIARDGLKFNKVLIKEWMDDVFAKLPKDKSRIDATEASIHHMYDILTMFNALFYASSHLAMATNELGNTVFMILLLERKKSHKPF